MGLLCCLATLVGAPLSLSLIMIALLGSLQLAGRSHSLVVTASFCGIACLALAHLIIAPTAAFVALCSDRGKRRTRACAWALVSLFGGFIPWSIMRLLTVWLGMQVDLS